MKKRMICILLTAAVASGLTAGSCSLTYATDESAQTPMSAITAALENWSTQPARGYQVSYETPSETGGWYVTIDEQNAQAMKWYTDANGENASPYQYVNQTLDQVERTGVSNGDGSQAYGNSILWQDGTWSQIPESFPSYADYTEQYASLAACGGIFSTNLFFGAALISDAFELSADDESNYEEAEGITTSDGQNAAAYSFTEFTFEDYGISPVYFCLDPETGELLEIRYKFSIDPEFDMTDETGDLSYTVKFLTGENCRKIALEEDVSAIPGFVQQQ